MPYRYYTEEAVFLSELALQGYYLKSKHATYAEAFYSFKRSKLCKKSGTLKNLSKLDILISLFFETILPYLKNKVELWIANQSETNINRRKWLIRFWRIASRIGQLLLFVYSFRYLLSPTFAYYKPYYQWFGFQIRRLNPFEQREEMKRPLLSRLLS